MNGSTNAISQMHGMVGFNPEAAIGLLKTIKSEFDMKYDEQERIYDRIYKAIRGESVEAAKIVPNYSTGTYVPQSYQAITGGWYSPEAQEFCNNVLRPKIEDSEKRMYSTYTQIYGMVLAAAKQWCLTTGQNISFPEWHGIAGKGHLSQFQVLTNKNGVVGIDPRLYDVVNDIALATMNFKYNTGYIHNYMHTHNCAFIGASQLDNLNTLIYSLNDQMGKNLDDTVITAKTKINEAIEKYQAVANTVASSFAGSPTSGVTGSTSNNFNTTN